MLRFEHYSAILNRLNKLLIGFLRKMECDLQSLNRRVFGFNAQWTKFANLRLQKGG